MLCPLRSFPSLVSVGNNDHFAEPFGKFPQAVERQNSVLDDGAPSYEDLRQENWRRPLPSTQAVSWCRKGVVVL